MGGNDKTDGEKSGGDKSGGENSALNITSPYYLHASDNPGQIYTGELLKDGNYGDWVNDMTNSLFAKNKIGFVDGTIMMPAADSTDLMNWKRCNAMVKGWLTSAMEKEIRNSVKYATTAREIWLDLEERFGKESAPRAYELRRAVTLLRQEGMSISAYYTKLRGYWDEIQSVTPTPKCTCRNCTCEISKELNVIREKEHLYEFLMGLNDEYATIKTQILSTKPTPTLGAAYHLVAEDEQQKIITASRKSLPEASAFQASNRIEDRGGYMNKKDEKGGPDRWNIKKDGPKCTKCNKKGHVIESCFEIIGYPSWWKGDHNGGRKQPQPRAANVQTEGSPIPGLTSDQYARVMQFFSKGDGSGKEHPMANMSGLTLEEPDWTG